MRDQGCRVGIDKAGDSLAYYVTRTAGGRVAELIPALEPEAMMINERLLVLRKRVRGWPLPELVRVVEQVLSDDPDSARLLAHYLLNDDPPTPPPLHDGQIAAITNLLQRRVQ